MFTRVLVPLDGSELAKGILPFVTQLARGLDLEVKLLSVVDPSDDAPAYLLSPVNAGGRSETTESAARRHHQEIVKLLSEQGVRAESIVAFGHSAQKIVLVAEREGCDLIAMSTHGRKALGRVFQGGVTDEVILSSHLPTLTVNAGVAERRWEDGNTISRIMVPLDGSGLAESALPHAQELARRLSLVIILVRAIGNGDARSAELESEATEHLTTVTERLEAQGLKVHWKLLFGPAGQSLVDFAHRAPHTLIVMATHGRSGLSRWIKGSATETVVRLSGHPVLIIPSQAAVRALHGNDISQDGGYASVGSEISPRHEGS